MFDELVELDSSFNQGMFITKVNNIFVMLHTAIMMDDLNRVRHFINDDLEKHYEEVLKKLNDKNARQMYDELNVKTTEVKDIIIEGEKAIIKVDIVSRYMDYLIDKNTGEFISGNRDRRVEKINHLTFEKNISAHYNGIVRKCSSCGASIDVNANGRCPYCGNIFKAEKYDWILTAIETI